MEEGRGVTAGAHNGRASVPRVKSIWVLTAAGALTTKARLRVGEVAQQLGPLATLRGPMMGALQGMQYFLPASTYSWAYYIQDPIFT